MDNTFNVSESDMMWVDEVLKKYAKKTKKVASELKTHFPFICRNGKYEESINDLPQDGICFWTNGFYPGLMWKMYLYTNDSAFSKKAQECENLLDEAFESFYGLHHDVGFMWLTSAVANYRITGNEESKKRGLKAASILASRYNVAGEYIRAWNADSNRGVAIIDCMLNIHLLFWASEVLDDPRYRFIALKHADKTAKYHLRPDSSLNHIVRYDETTGDVIECLGGQGYELGSSWSRGQAWGLYGFVLTYIHSKDKKYLNIAKNIAHYFIANVCNDWIPRCDFRCPEEPVYYDTTAGAIAACALIEIARCVGKYEKNLYLSAAINILKAMEKRFADYSEDNQSIMQMGSGSYSGSQNVPIIYADYYFVEALLKLNGKDILFW